jgi:hypothetical protein
MDHTFLVPVRMIAAGTLALRIGRLGSGELVGTLGLSQRWVRLARGALDDMLAPLGIEHITIDPDRVGEACTDGPPSQQRPSTEHLQTVAAAA